MSETGHAPIPGSAGPQPERDGREQVEEIVEAAVESAVDTVESAARTVDEAVPKVDDATDAQLGPAARRAAWMGPLFLLLAVVMVPWTIYLAVTLPRRAMAAHYDLSWVGFDIGLILALCWTAWCALRRSGMLAIAATANATLLVVDAWFDVVTSPTRTELLLSLAMALLVELPLAATCWWLARNGQLILEERVRLRMYQRWGRRGR